jgi:hypothetical protein
MRPSFFSDTISKCLADQNDEPLEILSDDEQVNGMELITIDDDIQDAEQIVLDCEDRGIDAGLAVPERQERKHDAFTRALFPLLGPSPTINKIEDKRMEPSTIGVLFDQVFIQAVEKYIEKPYHQVANHLNKVLHQECALDQQLKTLASVYLMLENDLMHSFCEALFIQVSLYIYNA